MDTSGDTSSFISLVDGRLELLAKGLLPTGASECMPSGETLNMHAHACPSTILILGLLRWTTAMPKPSLEG